MQQYLPFTVLKHMYILFVPIERDFVATVPIVYGIETFKSTESTLIPCSVATVPTVYGIETHASRFLLAQGH